MMMTTSHRLSLNDAKTLSLSALGGALEFYDFVIYVYFANVVGHLFFPPEMPDWLTQVQTYGIFAAGYLARPLGGVVMAHFGDLFGRKRMFMFSIFLMAVPTLAIGLMPTYETIGIAAPLLLLLFRVLQGAAIGGEAPGAWVFVSEHVSPRHTGFACGTLSAGLVAGILLGSLVATAVHASMSAEEVSDWGWRLPFVLGGALGFVTMYLRRWLQETPVFTELEQRQQLADEMPIKTVLKGHMPSVLISMAVTWVLTAAVVVTILMTPPLLQKIAGLDAQLSLEANSLAIIFLFAGCIIAGALADKFGNGPLLIIFSAGLAISFALFFSHMLSDTSLLFVLYPVVGFFAGLTGVVPAIAVKSFPPAIRFSGLSFSYNLAYAIFGGLTPLTVSMLLKYDALAPVYYVGFVCVVGVIAGLAVMRFNQQLDMSQTAAA
jgi:MFS family permease